jgi:hypothetical protein
MTRFFLPSSQGAASAESEYGALRDHAEASTGLQSRNRRIHEIECRWQGRDCLLRVGERDASNGHTVAAILQLGRDAYSVHHMPGAPLQSVAPTVLRRSDIYSVTEFD